MRANLLLAALGVASSVQAQITTCNADNCLRAVRNTLSASRGSADCNSFIARTVTGSAVTITRTATTLLSPSATVSTTEFDTVMFGTVSLTETSTVTLVATTTLTTTTSTETSVATSVVFVRRQAGPGSKTVPAYATVCSGAPRYSSACSCIGATGSTVTIPGPTVYVTVPATQTLATVTVVATQTSLTTVAASSTTVTEVSTVKGDPVTVTVPVDASTTVTSTSTSTTSQPTPTSFCLTSSMGTNNYVISQDGHSGANIIAKAVGSIGSPAVMFTINSETGQLISAAGLVAYVPFPYYNPQVMRLGSRVIITSDPTFFVVLKCSGVVGGQLACTAQAPAGGAVSKYDTFSRSVVNGMAVISSGPVFPALFDAITYTLSTVCPA